MRLARWDTWPSGEEPVVALTGVVSESVYASFKGAWNYTPGQATLATFVEETESVPFHVILTHATRQEDRALRRGLPRRTYLLGGHDHDIRHVEDDGAPIFKNLSNLQTIRILLLLSGGLGAYEQLHLELYFARG
jgi:hypothetical protein